jgi:hypothetical protein
MSKVKAEVWNKAYLNVERKIRAENPETVSIKKDAFELMVKVVDAAAWVCREVNSDSITYLKDCYKEYDRR